MGLSIHSVQLEPKHHALPEKTLSSLWVEADFIGVDAKKTGLV